jgi:hypothetical protein
MDNCKLQCGVARNEIGVLDSERLNDPLYAKALVLDDGGRTRLAIIAMDAVGIGDFDLTEAFLPELKRRLADELRIDQVLVNASHTHTVGPMLRSEAEVLAQTVDAVRQAANDLVPVAVGSGSGYEDRIMINRTLRLKSGKAWTVRQSIPCPPDEEVAGFGPVDPEIGVIRIDRLNGSPLAVVYNFACHPLIGVADGKVTANYPGFASAVIEENTGAMALFLQGAAGDITEAAYKDNESPRDSGMVGRVLGAGVLAAWRQIAVCGGATLAAVSETVEFPRRTDIPGLLVELKAKQQELLRSLRFLSLNFKSFLPLYLKYRLDPEYPSDYSYRYMHAAQTGDPWLKDRDAANREQLDRYLENIHAMELLAKLEDDVATLERHQKINLDSASDSVAAELVAFRIGDAVLTGTPVEALAEVGLTVKKNSPFPKTFLAAYSNGYMHYGAMPEDYPKGGYEVTECFLAPGWCPVYLEAVQRMLCRLKAAEQP